MFFLEIEKVDVFRKVLNKQFIERLRAIFIINKTQLHTPTACFTPWRDHQGDLIQIEFYLYYYSTFNSHYPIQTP